ncbi:hypothetical protein CCR87_05110 [Rhodobaculum claviforme]|uniref:Surface lipoprotein assembly modifier C-terminal domain-containing protein n=2 Tax=Rhodobaculum claviforme TaxID=1549854 RepID=A0A934WFI1_9RHOB|nr:hypothetical protein [Rhodobaculum claviforme]
MIRLGSSMAVALWAALVSVAPAAADGSIWREGAELVRAGELRAGIAALERAVTLTPAATGPRLDLGLAHYLDGNDAAARHHLEAALAGALQPRDRAVAQAALRRIEARRVWQTSVRFALIPQSNAARRPADREVTIAGLPFLLDQAAEPSTGAAFGLAVSGGPMLRPGLKLHMMLALDGALYEESVLNDYTLRAEAGVLRIEAARRWGGGVQAAHRWLGNRGYSREAGVYATLMLQPEDGRRHEVRADLLHRTVPQLPSRDAWVGRVSAVTLRAISPRTVLIGRAHVSRTEARRASESGWIVGGGVGAIRLFDGGWRAGIDLRLLREVRDGAAPVFGQRRAETEGAVRVHLLNRNLSWRGFAPQIALEVEQRRSDIALFNYTNRSVSLGLSRTF